MICLNSRIFSINNLEEIMIECGFFLNASQIFTVLHSTYVGGEAAVFLFFLRCLQSPLADFSLSIFSSLFFSFFV